MPHNKILYTAIITTGILAISGELASILYDMYLHFGKILPPELNNKFFSNINYTQDIWMSCIALIAWCAIPITLKIYHPTQKNISINLVPWKFLFVTIGGRIAGIASLIQCLNIFLFHFPYINDLCAWYIYGEFSRATWLMLQKKSPQQIQYILRTECIPIIIISITTTLLETCTGINIIIAALLPNIYTWGGELYTKR